MFTFIWVIVALIVGGFFGYIFGQANGEQAGYGRARTIYGPKPVSVDVKPAPAVAKATKTAKKTVTKTPKKVAKKSKARKSK